MFVAIAEALCARPKATDLSSASFDTAAIAVTVVFKSLRVSAALVMVVLRSADQWWMSSDD